MVNKWLDLWPCHCWWRPLSFTLWKSMSGSIPAASPERCLFDQMTTASCFNFVFAPPSLDENALRAHFFYQFLFCSLRLKLDIGLVPCHSLSIWGGRSPAELAPRGPSASSAWGNWSDPWLPQWLYSIPASTTLFLNNPGQGTFSTWHLFFDVAYTTKTHLWS